MNSLRRLGVSFASGPHALIESSWSSFLIEFLDRLSKVEGGTWPALAMFVGLAEAMQKERFVREWYMDPVQGATELGFGDYFEKVNRLCKIAVQLGEPLFERTLLKCTGGRGCGHIVQTAMSIAQPRSDVRAELATFNAWNMMQPWADSLLQSFEQSEFHRTLYLHWRTSDELVDRWKQGVNDIDRLDRLLDDLVSYAPSSPTAV